MPHKTWNNYFCQISVVTYWSIGPANILLYGTHYCLHVEYTNPAYQHSYFCQQKLTTLPSVAMHLAYHLQLSDPSMC